MPCSLWYNVAPGAIDGLPVDALAHFEAKLTVANVQPTATIWVIPQTKYPTLLCLDVLHSLEARILVPDQ